jgi:Fe-S cluster assembly ATP-binding protein
MSVLEVENLIVTVRSRVVLDDVSSRIKSEETHLLFGPNGSSNTTLINAVMGTLSPPQEMVSGRVVFRAARTMARTATAGNDSN